jgi:hypothetical protein
MTSILPATFKPGKGNVVYTKKAFQYDKGVYLRVSGIALPEHYQVHFSNSEHDGVSAAVMASGSDIKIPDSYFLTGQYIYCWLYMAEDFGKDGSSAYTIIVPVEKRPAALDVSRETGEIVATLDEDSHTLIFDYR